MKTFRSQLALALIALLSACGGGSDNSAPPATASFSTAAFVAPQSDLLETTGFAGQLPAFSQFQEQTVREIAHLSTGGSSLKIKLSNEFGTNPLTLDKVHIAQNLGHGTIDPSTDKAVTFSGQTSVTIPAGQVIESDDISFQTKAFMDLSVSIYMKSAAVRTARRYSETTTYVGAGDLTSSSAIPNATTETSIYYLAGVTVQRDKKTNVVVAIGDSITEGGASATIDAYNSWPDQLARLANAEFEVSIVNAGLGGNRWVKNTFGPCGVCRIARDVLNVPGVTHVIMALGVNDIGLGYYYSNTLKDPTQLVTSQQIISAIQEAVSQAKAKGLKVYLGTITPFKGTYYYTSGQPNEVPFGSTVPYNGEQVRQEVNAFIRTNTQIDGVIDFDKTMQDPSDPLHVRAAWSFDGTLHPNDIGYAHMAQTVDLNTLR